MKRAIVAAAFLAMACGGSDLGPAQNTAQDSSALVRPYAAGTMIEGCRCILDEGQPIFGVSGPADACASGMAVTTQCAGDVLMQCPCAENLPHSKPYDTCQHLLPAGSTVVLRSWTCT